MDPNSNTASVQEAFRRRASLGPESSAGIPGGAPAANATSAQNPLAQFAQQAAPPSGVQAPAQNMSQPGVDQLGKSMPGEANIILKALISRLKQNPPGV